MDESWIAGFPADGEFYRRVSRSVHNRCRLNAVLCPPDAECGGADLLFKGLLSCFVNCRSVELSSS